MYLWYYWLTVKDLMCIMKDEPPQQPIFESECVYLAVSPYYGLWPDRWANTIGKSCLLTIDNR